MEGFGHLCELPDRSPSGRLRRGPVKLMPHELEHEFQPSAPELARMLHRVEAAGRRAAVHAVTRAGVRTVLDAFESLAAVSPGHRIEHCGVCAPEDALRIRRLGLAVVTQPGFLYANGDLMLRRLPPEDLPDLYPLRRLRDAGASAAASSDAPVIEPDPIAGLRAAVQRRSRAGIEFGIAQAVSPEEALALFTSAAAAVLGLASERGRIAAGLRADLVVLSQDPTDGALDWDALKVDMTIMSGVVVHAAP
jgi:predicted amidohydrolase YtcJ